MNLRLTFKSLLKGWISFPFLGLLLIPILSQLTEAKPNSDAICKKPKIGTYIIASQGSKQNIPIGQLQLETWNSDGTLTGTRFLREGRSYNENFYTGKWKNIKNCTISVSRSEIGWDSSVILQSNGNPHFGIISTPGIVPSELWFPQSKKSCTKDTIVGTVLSVQVGHQLKDGKWLPDRVIQREQWNSWRMSGVAIASYSGKFEAATYQGKFTQTNNCIGSIRQQDAYGMTYNYIAILLSNGKGYVYLQTQDDALTLAVLEHSK